MEKTVEEDKKVEEGIRDRRKADKGKESLYCS